MHPSSSQNRVLMVVASAAVLGVAVAACGGGDHRQSQTSSDTLSTSSHGGSARVLPCQELIGTGPPVSGMHVVLGVVALPASPWTRRALQTARSGLRDPRARLLAKQGLVIRAGARFRLIVQGRLSDRLSIGWGNAREGHRGTHDCGECVLRTSGREVAGVRRRLLRSRSHVRTADRRREWTAATGSDRHRQGVRRPTPTAPTDERVIPHRGERSEPVICRGACVPAAASRSRGPGEDRGRGPLSWQLLGASSGFRWTARGVRSTLGQCREDRSSTSLHPRGDPPCGRSSAVSSSWRIWRRRSRRPRPAAARLCSSRVSRASARRG